MKKFYLAYGSNLNKEQMSLRCPSAVPVGYSYLEDHQLLFRGRLASGVLTVEPCAGCSVPLGVWEISEEDERSLDCYEGFPFLYRKETRHIQFVSFSSGETRTVDAMIYIMNDGRSRAVPTSGYLDICIKGYFDFGFDLSPLEDAVIASGGRRAAV